MSQTTRSADPLGPALQEARARALGLIEDDTLEGPERPFLVRTAILLEAAALLCLGKDEAAGRAHALDAFRLQTALGERRGAAALETAALGVYAGLATEAAAFLRDAGEPAQPPDDAPWDDYLLARLLEAWYALLAADDAERALRLTSSLYAEQPSREKPFFEGLRAQGKERAGAWRLACLYHWAQATHDIAQYQLTGQPNAALEQVQLHFDQAFRTADVELAGLLGWLRAAAPYPTPS